MTHGVDMPVLNALLEEVTALRNAANDAQEVLVATKATYEAMRPHWAMGYTSDSLAAQGSTAALSQLWQMLGADNQTAAVQTLHELTDVLKAVLDLFSYRGEDATDFAAHVENRIKDILIKTKA